MILHNCLPRRATLKHLRSLKPSPPSHFGLVSSLQLFQCIPLESLLFFHQKFERSDTTFLHMVFGRRKQFIVYVGSARATALRRTSFPPADKNLFCHPSILCYIISLRKLMTDTFEPPKDSGSPKYIPSPLV